MNNKKIEDKLYRMGACYDSMDWVARQPKSTQQELWQACKRGDWMLWYAKKTPKVYNSKGFRMAVLEMVGFGYRYLKPTSKIAYNMVKAHIEGSMRLSKKSLQNLADEVLDDWLATFSNQARFSGGLYYIIMALLDEKSRFYRLDDAIDCVIFYYDNLDYLYRKIRKVLKKHVTV